MGFLHRFHCFAIFQDPQAGFETASKPAKAILNREVRADKFAAELLAGAWASGQMHAPLYGPYGRAAISSNIFRIIAIGSNTHDFRKDPRGLLDGAPKPEVFQQSGYSHLNMYVRLLILLQQLEPAEERLNELRWISRQFTKK